MCVFLKPVSKKELAEILDMKKSTFSRRIDELPEKPDHRHFYSPKEADRLIIALGYELTGELLQRALKVTGQLPRDHKMSRNEPK